MNNAIDYQYKNYRDSLLTYTACKTGIFEIGGGKIAFAIILIII